MLCPEALLGIHVLTSQPIPGIRSGWLRVVSQGGALESDVNQDSIYGSYFKLTGIKLTRGSDFLTVYRSDNGTTTSIELFKCRGS